VLHLCPDERSVGGVAAYSEVFREGLQAAGARITTHAVRADAAFTLREVRNYAAMATELAAGRVDVLQAEIAGGSAHELAAVRKVLHRTQTPVVLTVHDPPRLIWTPFLGRMLRDRRAARAMARVALRRRSAAVERDILSRAAHVFVLSHIGRSALLQARPELSGDRVTVLPYPAAAQTGAAAPPPRPANGEFLIALYGHWYPGKGIETLLDAMHLLRNERPSVQLRIIGDAWNFGGRRSAQAYRSRILEAIESSGLRKSVELRGFVPGKEVGRELIACDAVVLPFECRRSVDDLASVSSAAFAALANGVPLVASNARAMPEIVTDGVNGLLFPGGDAPALAARLRQLRDDPALRQRLRDGAQRTSGSLSPGRTARCVLRVYEEVLGR